MQLPCGYLWLKVALAAAAAYLHTEAMTLPGVGHTFRHPTAQKDSMPHSVSKLQTRLVEMICLQD